MTKEQWMQVLTQFYYDCVDFWSREGLTEDEAIRKATTDVANTRHYPYAPNGELIPEDIKEEFLKNIPEYYGR